MRLYNGCPDDELKAIWDHRARLKAEARRLGYLLTWYPAEELWGAGYGPDAPEPYKPVGPMCRSIEEAMRHVREDAGQPEARSFADGSETGWHDEYGRECG